MDNTSPTTIYQIDNILQHLQDSIDIINTTLFSHEAILASHRSDIADIKTILANNTTSINCIIHSLSVLAMKPDIQNTLPQPLPLSPAPPTMLSSTVLNSATAPSSPTSPASSLASTEIKSTLRQLSKTQNPTSFNYDQVANNLTSALNSCPLLLPTAVIPPRTAPPTAPETTTAATTISAAASLFGNATSTMAAAPPTSTVAAPPTSTVAAPPLFAAITGSTIPSFPLDCIRLDSAPSAPAFPISLAAPPVHLLSLSTMASLIPVKQYDSTHQILKSFSDSHMEFLFGIPDTLHTIFQKQQLKVAFNSFDKSKHVDAQIPIGCRASFGQKYRNDETSPSIKMLGMNIIFIFDPGGIFRCRVFFFDLEDKVVFEGSVMIRNIDAPAINAQAARRPKRAIQRPATYLSHHAIN